MKILYRILLGLHLFIGIGGMFGGLAAILNPHNPMGMSVDDLVNFPFSSFLIPGILLFAVIGLGNVVSGLTLLSKCKYQGYISSIFSWGLVIWIIVQCIMLSAVVFLHILFFGLGLVQATLSAAILFERRLFPANVFLKILKR